MNKRLPISVFITTKNEGDRLPKAINSVSEWVDEILVVDSGNEDDTVQVATDLGADKVIFNQWRGYGPQKVFAEQRCHNNWVLSIDADKEISQLLRDEIITTFETHPVEAAFILQIPPPYTFPKSGHT